MEPVKNYPDLVVVIGMHRSGTSAIARGLATLGCTLGETLIEAIPGVNDKGFWEDVDINTFDQRLLEYCGTDWFHHVNLPPAYFDAPSLGTWRRQAGELLLQKLATGRPLALKEPRLTVLLPFWQKVFDDLGLHVGYVHAVRNPYEVAQSLLRRDNYSTAHSLLLWLQYNVIALRCTENQSVVVIDYATFLQDPLQQLERIARHLQISPPDREDPETRFYIEEFLDSSLRHGHCRIGEYGEVHPIVLKLYAHLLRISRDEPTENLLPEIDAWLVETNLHIQRIHDLESRNKQGHVSIHSLEKGLQDLQKQKELLLDEGRRHTEHLKEEHKKALQAQKEEHERGKQIYEERLADLQAKCERTERELQALLASRSWKWTKPLRRIVQTGRTLRSGKRASLAVLTRVEKISASGTGNRPFGDATLEPVRCRKNSSAILPSPVRFIAFHLPQFHEIAENNQWWGKGFTEWTNVQPAQPLFPCHYQPHVPLNGFYDLTSPEILPRQAEQARRYGIEGFCFYFYWFHGVRLLESPLRLLLEHPEWDVSYCLCWANENWTRRWDGLEQDVLIAQNYSETDDLAFIAYLEQYLRDPRYIRIQDRPLLLLYRPDLLPDARATVDRWRSYCQDVGVGELYITYPQSFEKVDPAIYGMDAAVEFPPNNSAPPEIALEQLSLPKNFSGKAYDWSIFPGRAKAYERPPYKLFRGLNPGWDNTPRRKNSATIFVNNDPISYQQWTEAASIDTVTRFSDPSERLVFINAWNEWGEGAHLEPDVCHECAYLEATEMGALRAAIRTNSITNKSERIAIVIHAFYPDVLEDMIPLLETIPEGRADVWITMPPEKRDAVQAQLARFHLTSHVIVSPNRGRDVLPFVSMLPNLLTQDYGYIVKVHTKKSPHRADGSAWRESFYRNLLQWDNIQRGMDILENHPKIGVLAPKEYLVPLSLFWGSNARHAKILATRLGITTQDLAQVRFVAGTMFLCRWSALLPIAALQLRDTDFEEECGQVDGTMAHAVERAFGMACYTAGLELSDF